MYQIKIIEGHKYSSYFWFHPVKVKLKNKITDDDVTELEDEISIEEGDIGSFLAYFFYKYFDNELPYNKNRYEGLYLKDFEWYLTYNFYTYDTMKKMLADISQKAELLSKDYDNPELAEIKKHFSIFYMTDDYDSNHNNEEILNDIRQNVNVVIDFYNRFVKRMNKMMEDNPETNLISIMGP